MFRRNEELENTGIVRTDEGKMGDVKGAEWLPVVTNGSEVYCLENVFFDLSYASVDAIYAQQIFLF